MTGIVPEMMPAVPLMHVSRNGKASEKVKYP
jgi:hypothetical protein